MLKHEIKAKNDCFQRQGLEQSGSPLGYIITETCTTIYHKTLSIDNDTFSDLNTVNFISNWYIC